MPRKITTYNDNIDLCYASLALCSQCLTNTFVCVKICLFRRAFFNETQLIIRSDEKHVVLFKDLPFCLPCRSLLSFVLSFQMTEEE